VLSLFLSGPAGASGALARGDELRELYEACFRETDASQGQISDACRPTLTDGQKVNFDVEQDRRSGKSAATNLSAA
jgi:hypothetical protein